MEIGYWPWILVQIVVETWGEEEEGGDADASDDLGDGLDGDGRVEVLGVQCGLGAFASLRGPVGTRIGVGGEA